MDSVTPASGAPQTNGEGTPAAMEPVVVVVSQVGKAYHLYNKPADRLKQQLLGGKKRHWGKEFWALRDVSFEIGRGETLGIIGRNGSGKSTLLQILAGVLQPTEGSVIVRGKVAALLELGSGFNPEYTGRENVYMNGAILGMTRQQMEQRFEQIAEFAEIGEFLDQPVKTYSSGMFVRLAFAVATHVEADVMIIDEALAVGDVFFRQKCYQRLEGMRERGVSIVLVSHAMNDVEQFCRRTILLHKGQMTFSGPSTEAVKRYYLLEQAEHRAAYAPAAGASAAGGSKANSTVDGTVVDTIGWPAEEAFVDLSGVAQVANGWARCTGIAVCDANGKGCRAFGQGETASFFYEFEALQPFDVPIGGVVIVNDTGVVVHGKNTLQYQSTVPTHVETGTRLRFRQDVTMDLDVREYTFEVGLAAIAAPSYAERNSYSHEELHARTVRLCHVPRAGQLVVLWARDGGPKQLHHYGVANLPGRCRMESIPPEHAV